MKEVIDELDSRELEPVFEEYFMALQRGKHLEQYPFLGGHYLVSFDGSGYFSSDKICCPGCLKKESKKGKIRYEHQIVQAALMNPDMRQVIPLKNQGYHIEHNYGHGEKYLSMNFFSVESTCFFHASDI
jgi:hypothetical protein